METGLAKLIEAIKEVWLHMKFYAAVYPWEHGALVRKGRYVKALEPGYYLKRPFHDLVISTATAVQTMRGPTQSIGERHFKWTCKYSVVDVKKYTCDIVNETQYLRDVLTAHVADFAREDAGPHAPGVDWEKYDRDQAWERMMKRLRAEAGEGGFKIHKLRLVDDVSGFSFRMFGDVGEMAEEDEK